MREDQLRDAWADYWQHPEWSARHCAEEHGLGLSTMHKGWTRLGLTQRRNGSKGLPKSKCVPKCPGFSSVFCAECPTVPTCTDWHCGACRDKKFCSCHDQVKPTIWVMAFNQWTKYRERSKKAIAMYRYAWSDPWKILGECRDADKSKQ